jgi:hypothetical protein
VIWTKSSLGAENILANFAPPTSRNTGTGSFAKTNDGFNIEELPLRKGDDFLEEQSLDKVDFIKIDTEGYEPLVLDGLRETIATKRPLVFFEWTQNELRSELSSMRNVFPTGYRFFQFVPDTIVLGLFRKLTYRLRPMDGDWKDGNILAIPKEYVKHVQITHPSSAAAHHVLGISA